MTLIEIGFAISIIGLAGLLMVGMMLCDMVEEKQRTSHKPDARAVSTMQAGSAYMAAQQAQANAFSQALQQVAQPYPGQSWSR